MSKLIFSSNGTILFHWFEAVRPSWTAGDTYLPKPSDTFVDIWDTINNQFRYKVPGYLIGVSNDSRTFLTQYATNSFSAWETTTGVELKLEHIAPDAYSYHQRVILSNENGLKVQDVFGKYPPQRISTSPDPVSNVVLGPYLFIAFWFDWGDIDGAYGHAIDLPTGEIAYTFSVDRHSAQVPIYFSTVHSMLFIGSDNLNDFVPYNIKTGAELKSSTANLMSGLLRKIRKQVNGVTFHPDGELMAVSLSENAIGIWNINTGRKIKTLRTT